MSTSNRHIKHANKGQYAVVTPMRYLPYNIFIDKSSIQGRYRHLPMEQTMTLYDFIIYTLLYGDGSDQVACDSLALDSAGVTNPLDYYIPENLWVTRTKTNSSVLKGMKENIDLYAAVHTVLINQCSCATGSALYYPVKKMKELYMPANFRLQFKGNLQYPFTKPEITRTDADGEGKIKKDKLVGLTGVSSEATSSKNVTNNLGPQVMERPNRAHSLKHIIWGIAKENSCESSIS